MTDEVSSDVVRCAYSAGLTLEFEDRCVPKMDEAIDKIILSCELDLLMAEYMLFGRRGEILVLKGD